MRGLTIGVALGIAAISAAQNVEKVYNRDTEEPFKLKGVKVERTVIGPIVRTSTVMTFDNPYKKLTEASVWFGMPDAAALSGFAYYFGKEYVPGKLMDKNKAWFIYTAITSRNEDPGIMDQWSPTSYHAQIYPLKVGSDLRVKLYSVGMVEPSDTSTKLPEPQIDLNPDAQRESFVRIAGQGPETKVDKGFSLPKSADPVQAVAQRFKDGRTYVVGVLNTAKDTDPATVAVVGLRDVKKVPISDTAMAFMGWAKSNDTLRVVSKDQNVLVKPQAIYKGSEAAKLWAQQKLATWEGTKRKDVLKFSLKYGIPSSVTAMLAVPQAQMKLFNAKEKQYQRQQARRRQLQREEARKQREWAKDRQQNWRHSSGGDPEIRLSFPNAQEVKAILPDGRTLKLEESGGFWGTNFDIPADAPEGTYSVRVMATNKDGTHEERTLTYDVDRTAPKGTIETRMVGGHLRIDVRSEPGLGQVTAWLIDGTELTFKEVEPGLYRLDLPNANPVHLVVTLTDKASNKTRLECHWSGSPATRY